MKKTVKSIIAGAIMVASVCAYGFSLPVVGTDTALNTWSRNMDGVLAAAKTTGYPIFLVMINDSSSGEGCEHCKLFVERTLNTSEFAAIVNDYKFYMVLLNIWGADTASSQPNYGGVSSSVFFNYFWKYNSDSGYPLVAVLSSDGKKYKGWGDSTNPSTRGTSLPRYIREAIADLSAQPSVTTFNLAAQSGNVVTVQADPSSPTMTPGVWTGVVTRSGGSGATGAVSISLSGDAAWRYQLSESSLSWDASDGSKTFTVTGPLRPDGSIVADTVVASISASGFEGSDISYGATSQAIVFKDSRVKYTLSEFAAANAGLGGLSSSDIWFTPSQDDGNVLEVITSSESTLFFNATVGGILTVEAGQGGGGIIATDSAGEIQLVNGQPVKFGVAPGQSISFKAMVAAGVANNIPIGFAQLSFQPLAVTLSKPANGAQISYGSLEADKSIVDMSWFANMDGCTFSLACGEVSVDMGTATSANAVDMGLVSLSPATRTYIWGVAALYSADDLRGTAVGTAISSFTVVSMPEYGSVPSSVVAYKSVGAFIDMSVDSVGGGTVTYSASGLPSGMKIDPATGVITGTPRKTKTFDVTVTASNPYGSASTSFKLSVENFPRNYSKPKYALFLFGGDDAILSSAQLSVSSSGKWNAKLSEAGRSKTLKGSLLTLRDGSLATGSSALDLVYSPATGIWSGSASGRRAYGRARDKANATWKGLWNVGFATSSAANLRGWAAAKVTASGSITFSGSISNKARISGSCYSAEFPDWFVATYLPRWAGHGNVRFGHIGAKSGVNMGCALFSDGALGGNVSFRGVDFDIVEGSFWSKSAIAQLNGSVFRTIGGGNVEVPVVATASRISAGENGYGARLTCTAKSGKVSASHKMDGKRWCKATGVIYEVGGKAKASGGGMAGEETYSFTIE